MTASAGADTPYGGTIGAVRTYAYTGNTEACLPDEWFAAIQAGRTFVTNGPMLELRVDGAMPGDEIVTDSDQTLTVTARAWGDAGDSAPERLRLVRLGETLEEVTTSEETQATLELSTQVKSGWGFWIAAHATSHDGAEAHTTPVYVTRKGFRHWNVETADRLINQQLAVLREIESEVLNSERLMQKNASPLDYWNRRTAEQADQVRSQLKQTRQFYERLRETLKTERSLREASSPG